VFALMDVSTRRWGDCAFVFLAEEAIHFTSESRFTNSN
jgi:hypothetical protein